MRLPNAQVDGIGHGSSKIKDLTNSRSINLMQSIGDPTLIHRNRLSSAENSVELLVATALSITDTAIRKDIDYYYYYYSDVNTKIQTN